MSVVSVNESTDSGVRTSSPLPAYAVLGVAVVLSLLVIVFDIPRPITGLIVIAITVVLILLRIHIGIAMVLAGCVGLFALGGFRVVEGTLKEVVFNGVASWQLSVLPMFILMGIIMWRGGLTDGTFAAARQWLGNLPGGLGVATSFAGAGLAATSGSTIGISYALGRISIPEMLKSGYRPSLATGVVASAGTLGGLIPPSGMVVIYAGLAQTPVGPQLLAILIPGLLVAVAFAAVVVVWGLLRPRDAPRLSMEGVTWATRARSLRGIVPIAVVIAIVMGGIFGGVFTATEAGAFGVLAAYVIAWVLRGKGQRGVRAWSRFMLTTLVQAVVSTAAVFLVIIGVTLLTRLVTISHIPQVITEVVSALGLGRVGLLLVLIVVYLILGMFLDPLAMMLLTVPILAAPLEAVGVEMLWFGAFVILIAELAILSPPLGILSFIVHRISQDPEVNLGKRVKLTEVFAGVTPFILAAVGVAIILIYFPDIVTWLPNISSAG